MRERIGILGECLDKQARNLNEINLINERINKLEANHLDQLSPYAFVALKRMIDELQKKLNTFIEFTKVVNDKKPYKCPVCCGDGRVRVETQNNILEPSEKIIIDMLGRRFKECRHCEGKGIVWG